MNVSSPYKHTQNGPWHWLLSAIALVMMALALWSHEPADARWLFVGLGTLFLVVSASFRHLTVEDAGDHLDIHFGPIPLFRKRIRYDTIREVEIGRTMFLDGWGIHWSVRGGWVWNICGFDCVVIRHDRGTLRLGTDDTENLAAFLTQRIG